MTMRYGPASDGTPCPPEPPVGTWVKDCYGGVTLHQSFEGWGAPGIMPFGKWEAMWEARGPLTECNPWGRELPPPEEKAFRAGWEAAMVFAGYPRSQEERDWDAGDIADAFKSWHGEKE